jgi:lantibiotic modifying enzyme
MVSSHREHHWANESARFTNARIRLIVELTMALGDRVSDPEHVQALIHGRRRSSFQQRGLAGHAGLAMFFAGLLQAREEPRFKQALHAYMKAAAHTGGPLVGGVFTGVAGLLAACGFAVPTEPRYSGLLQKCSNTLDPFQGGLYAELLQARTYSDYDLISGAAGTALAFASVGLTERARSACDYLVWLLQDSTRWSCPHPLRPGSASVHDLGMAHGLAGMVAALAIAAPSEERYEKAIIIGLDFLVANRTLDGHGWPGSVSAGASPPRKSRDAWCYGIPGCATALYLGARRVGRPEYEQFAIEALRSLSRVPYKEWQLEDHALCHGAAGNALVFFAVGTATRDAELADFALSLLDQVIDSWQPDAAFGYQAMTHNEGSVDAPGLLDGAAGIGLALLTLSGLCDSTWFTCFGLPNALIPVATRNVGSN